MDASALVLVSQGISAARTLADAVLKTRDTVKYGPVIAQMNEQLINVQGCLVTHNAEMMELQQKYHEACEALRELRRAAAERDRYSLFEISPRVFVYHVKPDCLNGEPDHYLCQPCFDKGTKSVLQKYSFFGAISLECTVCKSKFSTGITEHEGTSPTMRRG